MLPTKLVTGQLFKQGVVKKINQIIDYLKTQRIITDNRTIKTNQYTAGIGLQVISQGTGGTGGTGDGDSYPFQLSIQQQRTESGVVLSTALHIQDGYIQLFSDHFDGCNVNEYNKQYEGVDLTEIEDVGTYLVILMIEYYPDNNEYQEAQQQEIENAFIPTILFLEASNFEDLSDIPQAQGLYSTVLGIINVDYNDGEYIYQVSSFLRGDNMFQFNADHQYAITPTLPDIEDGTLIETPFTLQDYSFRVNDGLLKWHNSYFAFEHQEIEMADDKENHIYISFKPNTSGTLSAFASDQTLRRFDLTDGSYNIEIAQINYSSGVLQIKQYVNNEISLDQNMVSVGAFDQIPDYLTNKFDFRQSKWGMPAEPGIFGSYVLTSIVSGSSSDEFIYGKLGLTMLWDNIAGFQPMETKQQQEEPQFLMHYYNETLGAQTIGWHTYLSGSSGDGKYKFDVNGSLDKFMSISTQISGDNTTVTFSFKPQKNDPWPNEKLLMYKTANGKLSAFHVDYQQSKEAVFVYDLYNKNFVVTQPPDKEDDVKYWSLVGNEDGVDWLPYTSGTTSGNANCVVSGSLDSFLQITKETDKTVFQFAPQNDDPAPDEQALFTKDVDGSLVMWVPVVEGTQGLLSYTGDSAFNVIQPPASTEQTQFWYLAGNKDDGLTWKSVPSGATSGISQIEVDQSLEDLITVISGNILGFTPSVDSDPHSGEDALLTKDTDGNFGYTTGQNVMYYFDSTGQLTTFNLNSDGIVYIQDGVPQVLNDGAGIVMTNEDGIPYIKSIDNLEGLLKVEDGQLDAIGPNVSDDVQLLASSEGSIYWEDTAECEQPQE